MAEDKFDPTKLSLGVTKDQVEPERDLATEIGQKLVTEEDVKPVILEEKEETKSEPRQLEQELKPGKEIPVLGKPDDAKLIMLRNRMVELMNGETEDNIPLSSPYWTAKNEFQKYLVDRNSA